MSKTTQEGVKFDQEKLPWHLTPWDALRAIVKVLAFGAKKYGDRNWEAGMDWHRLHRAAIGHLIDWWENEGPDSETGYSHLWHAGCCVLFLIAYELRGVGRDTRPKQRQNPPPPPGYKYVEGFDITKAPPGSIIPLEQTE